jgi:dienelactone hydrolase
MIEKTLDITTKDGAMETFICHPERNGPSPAVFLLMDAHGIREELKDMARRLGTVGYYVLLPNLYYRAGRDTIYGPDVQQEGSAEHHCCSARGTPGDAVDRVASTQEKRALPMPRSRFPTEMDFRKTSSAAEAVSAVWAAAVEPRGPTSPASIAPTELSGMPQIQVRGVWVYV